MAHRPGGSIGTAGDRSRRSEPSQRQLRVGEQLRHLIAEDLAQGALHDQRLERASVTVAEVRVSRDLKHAVVFVTELGRPMSTETREALDRAAPRLAGRLARRMHLKFAPRLRFVADATFDEAARMQRLIDADLERVAARRTASDEFDGGHPETDHG